MKKEREIEEGGKTERSREEGEEYEPYRLDFLSHCIREGNGLTT